MSTRGNPVPDAVGCELRRSAACDYCGNRKYPMQTNLRPRHLDDGRKHSRRDSCACWFRKIAAMAWYRVELERPPQLPPVQDFLECHPNPNRQMLSSESQRARAPACCSSPSRAVNPLLPGGVAQLLRAINASGRCTHCSHHPAIYSQTWLFLLAVIRCYSRRPVAKKRGFPRHTSTPSLFFPCISAKTAALAALTLRGRVDHVAGPRTPSAHSGQP
jgi:hypothetical protein